MINLVWLGLGVMFGSAANALIDRLPRKESWVSGRSKCDECGHPLGFFDLIPVVSYLLLGGKCRYCSKKIKSRNLIVEVGMGAGFLALGNPLLCAILWVTTIIFVMDWETMLVADSMIVIWAGLIGIYHMSFGQLISQFGNLALGSLVGVVIIGGIWFLSRGRAMGSGDIGIAAVMGFWLSWPNILPALWLAFVLGAMVGCWMLIVSKKNLKSMIAFGPFLILGTWIAHFWGDMMMTWIFRY